MFLWWSSFTEGEMVNFGSHSNCEQHPYILMSRWGRVFFTYPSKSFLHNELSCLQFEVFEATSRDGCPAVCVDVLTGLNTCRVTASNRTGHFTESFWKENWLRRSLWTLGMMAERNRLNFYGVPSYRSQKAICKHRRNVREKRGNKVHPAPKASVKNYMAQMAEMVFTFIAHVVWSLLSPVQSFCWSMVVIPPISAWACFPFP